MRNCCNASSCLLRHSYTVLYFQGSGNRRVTVNAIAWEHLCGQATGKGDPKEVSEKRQLFCRNPKRSLTLWLAHCSPSIHTPLGKGRPCSLNQDVCIWCCLYVVGLFYQKKSCLHGMQVPLRYSPGHQAYCCFTRLSRQSASLDLPITKNIPPGTARHSEVVSPSAVHADNPSGRRPVCCFYSYFLKVYWEKKSEMTGVKEETES